MARTNTEEVNEILTTSMTEPELEAYIGIANTIVTDDLDSSLLSADRLALIERYLTAHLIVCSKERIGTREKLGEAEITYAGVFGSGLQSSHYGQMLVMLDTTGTLAAMGKKKVSIVAITSFS